MKLIALENGCSTCTLCYTWTWQLTLSQLSNSTCIWTPPCYRQLRVLCAISPYIYFFVKLTHLIWTPNDTEDIKATTLVQNGGEKIMMLSSSGWKYDCLKLDATDCKIGRWRCEYTLKFMAALRKVPVYCKKSLRLNSNLCSMGLSWEQLHVQIVNHYLTRWEIISLKKLKSPHGFKQTNKFLFLYNAENTTWIKRTREIAGNITAHSLSPSVLVTTWVAKGLPRLRNIPFHHLFNIVGE